jgi:cytochrome c oxidase subunit 4
MAHEAIHTDANDASNVTNPEHAQHHIVTPLQYVYVFATLLFFTGVTVWAAYVPFGIFNPVIALGIASFKATIVILFFMHAAYQSRLIKMTIGAGFFMFLVLVTMTMSDYISRSWGLW